MFVGLNITSMQRWFHCKNKKKLNDIKVSSPEHDYSMAILYRSVETQSAEKETKVHPRIFV